MLFKLSVKNMKKSFKDYAIYFLTLVLGVAIFYMFNSLDSQQAMLEVSASTRELIRLMISMLGYVSVFVAVILGLLIVYANNFLINRRKKEFGIYMTLGMGKRQISKIILIETILIGVLSLITGIIIGVFASQFMSILVGKLFEADMTKFQFVFSKDACIKTCLYFAIMYIAVMIFNTITISRYKLINLLTAIKKNETVKIKNPVLSILVFLAGAGILGYSYWKVTGGVESLSTADKILPIIVMGIVGTIAIFWSLSGFVLKVVQTRKNIYLKGTNMFVLRQLNNKINTTVISMSVICLMLFMTISILSSSLSLRNTMQKDLKEMTPVDVNLYKTANLPESYLKYGTYGSEITPTQEAREDSKYPVSYTLKNAGYDMNKLKDIVEMPIYATDEWTWKDSLGNQFENVKAQYSMLQYDTPETLIKVSDYNKFARMYGLEEHSLNEDEFVVLADYDNMIQVRNQALKSGISIMLNGKEYHSKYNECKEGYIMMSTSHMNTGIIIVPDSCELKEEWKEQYILSANYNAETEEEKRELDKELVDKESGLATEIEKKGIPINGMTKITIVEASLGVSTIVIFIAIYLGIVFLIASAAILALKQLTESSDNKQRYLILRKIGGVSTIVIFIAIYLGIVFLIASAAILALKQLTESSDNKQRYLILRKIGCDEKTINKALFRQIAIFFMLPLVLAIIHSIFGIQFVMTMMSGLATTKELLPSVIATVVCNILYVAIGTCNNTFNIWNTICYDYDVRVSNYKRIITICNSYSSDNWSSLWTIFLSNIFRK